LATYKAPKNQDSTDSGEPPFQDFPPRMFILISRQHVPQQGEKTERDDIPV
ncbi:hypothetical protein M378DRAFT_156528, partial [Amanita muscaria Koide BX008]